jgi:hypothetical protein
MDNATFEKMKEAQQRYHSTAMNIPGVHGTSIGLKRVKGKLTRKFAIVIHLTKKRPAADVPANERIPKQIEGFPTDVIEHDQPEPHDDGGKYRPVQGGCQLAVSNHYGTLGCIVKDRSDSAMCALSNQHVLLGQGTGVFQPKTDPVCDAIGWTKRSVLSTNVDGGISSLDRYDVTSTAKIIDIGNVTGSRTLTWADLPCAVKKRGRTTGLRSGRITSINYNGQRTDGWNFTGQQFIQSDAGTFSEPGDSGSAVVDSAVKVVGLLWGGALAPGTYGASSPIEQVCSQLNVEVQVFTAAEVQPAYSETLAGRLEALLLETSRGRDYWKAIQRHQLTVVHMFHQVPRLHAVWLKLPYEELVEAVTKAIRNPDSKIPSKIGSQDTVAVLGQLRSSLKRYVTDEALARQIDALYRDLTGNIGKSWRKALADKPVTSRRTVKV